MRLYMGVFNMNQQNGNTQTIETHQYCAWKESADAARGEWVADVMKKTPGYTMLGAFVNDITDIARSEP